MTENKPFTLDIKVKNYGWTIKLFEPLMTELEAFDAEVSKLVSNKSPKDADFEPIRGLFVNMIHSWDCVDRKGQPLPLTLEGIRQIPPSAFFAMAIELPKVLRTGFSDPKESEASKPITPPDADTTKTPPETPQPPPLT